MNLESGTDTYESEALADILKGGVFIDGDWVETKDQDPDGEVRLIQLADVGDGYFRDRSSRFLTMTKAKELRCTFLEPGDILIARMPEPLGRACIFPGAGQPAVTVVDVCILRPDPARVMSDWLVKAINSPDFREGMQQFVRGTTRQRISRRNLGTLNIDVPSVPDQVRLSQLVDSLEQKRSNAAVHAAAAKKAIERFRQAVLAAACAGRLTADWRESHRPTGASDILAELREASVGRSKRHAIVNHLELDDLDELPTTWTWAAIGEIGDVQLGGTPSRKIPTYWDGRIPWVSSGEVANCRITMTRETISQLGLDNSNAKLYPAGTVLIAMIGEGKTRGQSAILDIDASTNQNAAGILPDSRVVSGEYIWRWALAQYEITRAVGRGGNQPALNGQKVRELVIPIPPAEEQTEIVRRVDQLLTVAESVNHRLDATLRHIARASQAVLAKAVHGDLVEYRR